MSGEGQGQVPSVGQCSQLTSGPETAAGPDMGLEGIADKMISGMPGARHRLFERELLSKLASAPDAFHNKHQSSGPNGIRLPEVSSAAPWQS